MARQQVGMAGVLGAWGVWAAALAGAGAGATRLAAQTVPAGFVRTVPVTNGPATATQFVRRPDGSYLIALKDGTIRVYRNGALVAAPFVTLASVYSGAECGLIGITIDPGYAQNGYVYVRVVRQTGDSGIERLGTAMDGSGAPGDAAAAGSETLLMTVESRYGIHQGGAVHFGPDRKLYFSVGEQGTGSNAPLLTNLWGKVMRINSDGTIPEDNPFYGAATGNMRAIWCKGLRNPFTFCFQPETGRMHINHVGGSWEEVNVGMAGADYGWPSTEGTFDQGAHPGLEEPLYTYATAPGAAIIGAAFYPQRGGQFPVQYAGKYFFGDHVRGTLSWLDPATGVATAFGTGFTVMVDLDVTPEGKLVVLRRNGSIITEIGYTLGACCSASGACAVTTGLACAAPGAFRGLGSACTPAACCAVNVNHDGALDVHDIFDFLAAWFADEPSADFNGVGGVTVQDVFDYLAAWFVGCG